MPRTQWSGLQMTSACLKLFCGLVLIVLAAVLLVRELLIPTNQAQRPEIWQRKVVAGSLPVLTGQPDLQAPGAHGRLFEEEPAFVEAAKGQV